MVHTLSSNALAARVDLDSFQMIGLENRLTDETLDLAPQGGITLGMEESLLQLSGAQAKLLEADDHHLKVSYLTDAFEVEVTWTLREDQHFLHQQVRFRPLFDSPYLIRRVDLQTFGLPERVGELVPFQHGQCRTYFLRQQQGGFMFGITVPVLDEEQADPKRITLGYPVNYRFEPGAEYVAETLFWGAYRLSGRLAPTVPRAVKECIQSQRQPDYAESEAMMAMVETMLERPWRGPVVALNGCQLKTTSAPYDEEHRASVEADKEIFIRARDMLGECIIQPAPTWAGAQVEVHRLTSQDARLPEMPVREEFLDWAAANGFRVGMYTPLKGPSPWAFDVAGNLFVYCPDRPEWQGECDRICSARRMAEASHSGVVRWEVESDSIYSDSLYNCPVNRPYMKWLTQLLTDDLRRHPQIGEWVSDEWVPIPRYSLPCTKVGHDHLPGDASYGYFLVRRELFRRIGGEFPELLLNGERPNQDTGIWDALYLDSLYSLSEEMEGIGSDTRRFWSRIRHHYHFLPASRDEVAILNFSPENPDYVMLSALAVSCNYVFAELPRDWSPAELRRLRRWVDWARQHAELMRESHFLPDWPFQGRCDGYVRVSNQEAYAFIFNSNDRPAPAVLPLDGSAGLASGASYRVAVEHTTAGDAPVADQVVRSGQIEFTLPPHVAALLRIEPA